MKPNHNLAIAKTTVAETVIFFAVMSCLAQTPAFPGAVGHGSYSTGGRNGTVYHVTNTNDSGAGSFRSGVAGGNRTIVFDVGGEIKLLTAVSCASSLTIAGQTAPGGIVIDGGEISFANHTNIICRYLRIRPGSDTASTGDDCISLYNARNAIFDHVSMEFGPWNNVDAVSGNWQVTPVTDITFQNCIDANPIGQQFGAHTESVASDWTWCYNIFANSHNRNPLAKVNTVFINNIEYNNSAGYTTHTSSTFDHDIVNNYFVAGPASSSGNFPWYQVDNNQSMYFTGNLYDSDKNGVLGGSTTNPLPGYQGGGTILSSPWSSWTSIIPTASAPLAWRYGISAAGAFPRDQVDTLVISQMQTLGSGTTGTGSGTTGPDGGLYTSQTQTGLGNNGYGVLTGGTAPANFKGDGIADYWKLANNLSTNVSYPLTNTATGYTLLENYLNFLAAPHAVTQTNTPVDINLSQFAAGFSGSAIFSLPNATNGTVTLVNSTNTHFVPTANFAGLGGFTFTVSQSGYALSAFVTVCVTPITPPASAAGFNGAMIVVATNATATVVTPPANLTWRGDGTANVWNTSVSNWLNNSVLSKYRDSDVVAFDDTGSNTPAINLASTVTPGAVLFDNDIDYILAGSGAISGSGTFSKTGSGTLLVGTTNSSFTGGVFISGGTLALSNGVSLGSGTVTLGGGATVSLPGSGGAVFVNGIVNLPAGESATITSISPGNGLTNNVTSGDSTAVLTLGGSVGFTGTTTNQLNGFTGTINIPPGATLRFSANSGNNTYGSLSPNFLINGTLQPRNSTNAIILGALNGSGMIAGPQSSSTGTGATVYYVGGKNQDAIFNGTVASNTADAGSLVCFIKVGNGTQMLNGNDTFTGTNLVGAGTLLLNGTNQPSLTTVFSNATLGGTGTINGPVTVSSGGILSPGGTGVGTFNINNHLTNTSPVLNFTLSGSPSGANDRINITGTLAMFGVQTFNFNLSQNALGAGTYVLIEGANNSTQSGVSFASNLPGNTRQTILLDSAPIGSNPSYVRLIVSGAAGSLVWTGTNGNAWDTSTINWLNGVVADQFYNLDTATFNETSTNGTVSLVGTLRSAALTVSNNSLAYTFGGTGTLAGSEPLTKTGSGTLTINTTNSGYTGSILLSGGTLAANAPSSLGSGSLAISNSATLSLTAAGTLAYGGQITIPANTTGTIASVTVGNGLSGNVFSGNSGSVLNLSGGVSFSGTNSTQFDNFTGTISIPSGTILRYSPNSSGHTFGSFNPTLVINGTVQPRNAGNTVQLGTFTGSGTLGGQQAASAGTGPVTYVIGGNNTSATFSGTIVDANATNLTTLYKIGTGTLTLSGNSTFTGGTTVSAGTLLVNNVAGSATGTGDLEFFSGATLTGKGIIGSSTTIDNGATLAPGNPNGTLTISNSLTLNDSSLLQFGLGTNSDSVTVSGDLALTGQLTVTNSGGFGVGAYPLFTCGGALSFGNLTLASAPAGYHYSFNTNTPGVVKLVAAPTTPPGFGSTILSGMNLVFSGSNGVPLGTYYVLTTTNLILPLASWTCVATNLFDSGGNFIFTNAFNPNLMQTFYALRLP